MTAIASSSALVQGASTLHRTESYIFEQSIPHVELDSSSTPYYVSRWSKSETMAPAPPPAPPPPPTKSVKSGSKTTAPAIPPPPPPPPPPSTRLIKSIVPATGTSAPPPPAPPPPLPTKSITQASKTTASPPPPPPPFTKPVPQVSIARPSNASLSQHKLKPTRTIPSLSTPSSSSPSPPIPPKPLPITLSYESYDILAPYPDGDPIPMIYVPLGKIINFRGRYFPLTSEILSSLKGTPISSPCENLQDGIYVPLSECELNPPFRLSEKDERMRERYTKSPIRVNIPRSIGIANSKINEDERSVTIPPSSSLTVVRLGTAHLVPVQAMWSVDLGYSKAVNSQMGYLERLGVLGGKQPGVWVDREGLGEVEVEVVRRVDMEGVNDREREGRREEVRDKTGKGKGRGKRVRYCADGINENQVAKGPMKPRSREVIDREEEEEEEERMTLLDELEGMDEREDDGDD